MYSTQSPTMTSCSQAALLLAALAWGLGAWGAPEGSALHAPAADYLRWRAAGAPAYALLLACQVP
jgi:Na+-driven multidrug efflux pump